MSDLTDEQREQEIRALAAYPTDGAWQPWVAPLLLRLLDAERARADAAERVLLNVRWLCSQSVTLDAEDLEALLE